MERLEKRALLNKAEQDGRVADSLDVRMKLMNRVKSGELTLKEAQSQLTRIKRDAKRAGMVTRNQAYNGANRVKPKRGLKPITLRRADICTPTLEVLVGWRGERSGNDLVVERAAKSRLTASLY